MSYPSGGYPGYPPAAGYPPPSGAGYAPSGGYPPMGMNPQAAYPGAQPGYQGKPAAGYPPAAGAYPPAGAQGGYPPQQGGYPPPQQGGYPPPQQGGYPPSARPTNTSSQYGLSTATSGLSTATSYPPPPQTGPSGYGQPSGAPPQGASQSWYGQYYNQINPNDMQMLSAWFNSVDRDRSGEISVAELAQLNFNNRLLGPDAARKIIAIFDKDRSGQINFNEYASLHQFMNMLLGHYQAAERRAQMTGGINPSDISQALSSAGFNLSPAAVANISKRFDTQRRGVLNWDDFLALCSHVALLRSVFEWSDTDRDGKITFDFEAFAYATLYL